MTADIAVGFGTRNILYIFAQAWTFISELDSNYFTVLLHFH